MNLNQIVGTISRSQPLGRCEDELRLADMRSIVYISTIEFETTRRLNSDKPAPRRDARYAGVLDRVSAEACAWACATVR